MKGHGTQYPIDDDSHTIKNEWNPITPSARTHAAYSSAYLLGSFVSLP